MKNIDKCYIIACLYMNDMLILDNNNYMIKSTKKILINKFDVKDSGVVDVMLKIKIFRTSDKLVLS